MIFTRSLARTITIALVTITGSAALAQQPCEARVKELEEQLRQSDNRVQDLMRETERLRSDLLALQATPAATTAKSSIDIVPDPMSSPAALFETLVKDYNDKLGSLPRESKPDLAAYHAAVKDWARDAAKNYRGPVEWEVQLEKVDSGVKGNAITFYVLDPAGKPVGKSFTKPVTARIAADAPRAAGTMILKGIVTAKPTHDSGRAEKGDSDAPMFIGPFAEFDFDLEVTSLK